MAEDKVIRINLDELKNQKTIVVSATPAQLTSIKSLLTIDDSRIKQLGKDIYQLSISYKKVLAPKILEEITLGDTERSAKAKRIQLPDFDNSPQFYEAAKKKRGYKIVSDEFSNRRNQELYKGFQLIERRWRQVTLIWSKVNNTPITTNNSKVADHAIATYGLSEFYEQFFFTPASEEYMRKQWQASKTKDEDEVIRIANLRKLDELGIKLSKDELKVIQEQRNRCMHFRIVTPDEYQEVVPLINNYLIAEERKEFFNAMFASSQELSKSLQASIGSLADAIRSTTESLSLLSSSYIPNASDISAFLASMINDIGKTGLKKAKPENEGTTKNRGI